MKAGSILLLGILGVFGYLLFKQVNQSSPSQLPRLGGAPGSPSGGSQVSGPHDTFGSILHDVANIGETLRSFFGHGDDQPAQQGTYNL